MSCTITRGFHSYASRIGSKPKSTLRMPTSLMFPFIRFTNWKQGFFWFLPFCRGPKKVSIHTLHELEASLLRYSVFFWLFRVSIHTLHELEASATSNGRCQEFLKFPFIRFTNWKQGGRLVNPSWRRLVPFPFIRFTNWKQVKRYPTLCCAFNGFHSYASRIGSKCYLYWYLLFLYSTGRFHSYASRIGSKRRGGITPPFKKQSFHSYASRIGSKSLGAPTKTHVTTYSFHSYASRIGSKTSFAKLGCTRIVQRFFVGYWKISHN